jgi:hypothetical protein
MPQQEPAQIVIVQAHTSVYDSLSAAGVMATLSEALGLKPEAHDQTNVSEAGAIRNYEGVSVRVGAAHGRSLPGRGIEQVILMFAAADPDRQATIPERVVDAVMSAAVSAFADGRV